MDDAYSRSERTTAAIIAATGFFVCWFLNSTAARADCAPPDSLPPLCLTGTVTAPDYGGASVVEAGSPGTLWLQRGDTLRDWKLAMIGSGYIVLTHRGQSVRLDLSGNATSNAPVLDVAAHDAAPAKPAAPAVKQGSMRRLHAWEARGEREAPQ